MKIRKRLAVLSTLLMGFAGSSYAGGLVETKPEAAPGAPVMAPSVVDWSGPYAGLSYSRGKSTNNYYFGGVFDNGPWDLEGDVPGLFAGYNFQNGNLVYGGELSASFGEIRGLPSGFEAQEYSRIIDLKGRVGYATGAVLLYGTLGYSFSRFAEDYAAPEKATLHGFGYGLGLDYQFGSRFFGGIEYFRRDQSGDLEYAMPAGWTIEDTNLDTLSIRLGMRF